MKYEALLVAVVALLLGACAAKMSKDECRTVDWRTVGYEDGVAGRPGDRIGEHRRACAEYGVTPDLNAYLAGRTAGLREYCQPHNGYRAGVSGYTYYDTCPADLAEQFEKAYDEGRALYVRERRVTETDELIEEKRSEIRRLEDRVAESAFDVIDATSTAEERTQAVLDTKQAAESIGQLKSEITELEKERARYQAELDAYRRTVVARY